MCQSASRVKLILGLSSTSKVEDLWTTRLGTAYRQRIPFSLIVVALFAMQNSSHLVSSVDRHTPVGAAEVTLEPTAGPLAEPSCLTLIIPLHRESSRFHSLTSEVEPSDHFFFTLSLATGYTSKQKSTTDTFGWLQALASGTP